MAADHCGLPQYQLAYWERRNAAVHWRGCRRNPAAHYRERKFAEVFDVHIPAPSNRLRSKAGSRPWPKIRVKSLKAVRSGFVGRQPIGQLGTAAEVAARALFLTSDEASYITGQAQFIKRGTDSGWDSQATKPNGSV
jgi:NAD(P)-dependent dehydrogenase (short-subunit alcohol dehydrogenase family)